MEEKDKLDIKNSTILFVSVTIILFTSILILGIFFDQKKSIERQNDHFYKSVERSYTHIIEDMEDYYQRHLYELLEKEGVKEAIASKNREKLIQILEKRWKTLQENYKFLSVLHFHSPDGTSLLRMHNLKLFGDDIASKRPMLSHIHKIREPQIGLEGGVHLTAYRIIVPIFYNNSYQGAVEFGINPNELIERLIKTTDTQSALFSKDLKVIDKEFKPVEKKRIDQYILEYHSLDDSSLIGAIPKNYAFNDTLTVTSRDKTYDITVFNHKDFKGEVVAKTLLFNDITEITNNFHSSIFKLILLSLALMVILIFVIKANLGKVLEELNRSNKELKKNLAFLEGYKIAMDESSIISKADLNGKITYVNDNFTKASGYGKEEAIGQNHNLVRHPDNPKEIFTDMWQTINSKKIWKGILKNRGKTQDYWVDISMVPILDADGETVEYIALRHDITELITQRETLKSIAKTDALTGLGNRYKLYLDLEKTAEPALAIINIDKFSQINDFYGHLIGDNLIKKVGSTIKSLLNSEEMELYHLSGDEFVITNRRNQSKFIEDIEKLINEISKNPFKIEDETLFLNFTTAISFEDVDSILSTANMAFKVAKRENRDLVIYSKDLSLDDEYSKNIMWSKKIKSAIEKDRFVPFYQPIVNNSSGEWEKYESLVRMLDDGKVVSPFFFLEISKQTKHYIQITKIMIRKSFEFFKTREEEFSINITIENILDREINSYIFDMLLEYKIGERVVFEIVESESIENFNLVRDFIDKLKTYNCKVAIDDFGTGYSNFEYLLKLKADYIKIDGSMIKNIDQDEDAQKVVSTIVDFSKKIGAKTVAEFVENESIERVVKELGIDYSQGYHYSPPKEKI